MYDHIALILNRSFEIGDLQLNEINSIELDLENYMTYTLAADVVLLHCVYSAERSKFEYALDDIEILIKFGKLLQQQKNATLISYVIGAAIKEKGLHCAYRLSTYAGLTKERVRAINEKLNSLNKIMNDGFNDTLKGEYRFANSVSYNESEIYQYYLMETDIDNFIAQSENKDNDELSILQKLLVKYVYHRNRSLSDLATKLSERLKYIDLTCNVLPPDDFVDDQDWYSSFLPNYLGKKYFDFNSYAYRRCASYSFNSMVQLSLAINVYHRDRGTYPAALKDLVPDYISELPIDYFSNKPILYDADKQILYSIGSDFLDDGGNEDCLFFHTNQLTKKCLSQPTLPVAYKRWYDYNRD